MGVRDEINTSKMPSLSSKSVSIEADLDDLTSVAGFFEQLGAHMKLSQSTKIRITVEFLDGLVISRTSTSG